MHARVRPLCAGGQLDPTACSDSRTFVPDSPLLLELVDPFVLTETAKLRLLFSVGT